MTAPMTADQLYEAVAYLDATGWRDASRSTQLAADQLRRREIAAQEIGRELRMSRGPEPIVGPDLTDPELGELAITAVSKLYDITLLANAVAAQANSNGELG